MEFFPAQSYYSYGMKHLVWECFLTCILWYIECVCMYLYTYIYIMCVYNIGFIERRRRSFCVETNSSPRQSCMSMICSFRLISTLFFVWKQLGMFQFTYDIPMFFYNWHWKMNHPEESNLPCAGGLHAKRIGAPRWLLVTPLFPPWVALKMGHPMAHGIQKFRCFKTRFTVVHMQVRIISFHNPIYFHKFHTDFHIHNSFLWVTLQLRSSYLSPVTQRSQKELPEAVRLVGSSQKISFREPGFCHLLLARCNLWFYVSSWG